MKTLNKIINHIDSELLKLSKGKSYDFDFLKELALFRSEMKRYGQNEYLTEKAAEYVGVFNDLCNTTVKTLCYKDLEYDSSKKIAKVEVTTIETGKPITIEIIEESIEPNVFDKENPRIYEVVKYSYLNKSTTSIENQPEESIKIWFRSLKQGQRFDDFFKGVKGVNISFESYIDELKREAGIKEQRESIEDEKPTDRDWSECRDVLIGEGYFEPIDNIYFNALMNGKEHPYPKKENRSKWKKGVDAWRFHHHLDIPYHIFTKYFFILNTAGEEKPLDLTCIGKAEKEGEINRILFEQFGIPHKNIEMKPTFKPPIKLK